MLSRISRSLLLICIGVAGLVCATVRGDEVDEYVRAWMRSRDLPGLALAVDRGGSVAKMACYGMANVELETPVAPDTVFQIQSMTKSFVATAIMMLVDEERICVDEKVSAYLENTPDTWKCITVRHLLTHTSGIKDFINEPTASLRLDVTDEEVFAATAARPLNFEPGEKYAYSNSNYHLLAMIIRKVTGEHYGAFLKKRVFDPLGMTRTRVMNWSEIVPHRAMGYVRQGGKLRNGDYVAGSILAYGGGGLLSTIEDLVKWDLALRGETLLKRSVLEQMWSPAKLNSGAKSDYGFGWGIAGKPPHRWVSHSGGHMTGFTSTIVRYIDDDLTVVVLANSTSADPAKLASGIAGIYISALKQPERKPIEDSEME
ncbi:MAG: serine hydrolase domain-containing protein [Verrucomicrobiia bacterium]